MPKKLKRLHSDGAGETINADVDSFLKENGTIHTTTVPHTSQHNLIERANRTLIDMVKAMMVHCDAFLPLWGEAALTAAYLLRRSLSRGDPIRTPVEAWTGINLT